MQVSIVIPNYNGAHLLEKNVPKVIEALEFYCEKQNAKGEVIIVDDCSQDASMELLESGKLKGKNSELHFYRNERNMGFSSNVDNGVAKASGEIVILLNSDVVPDKDFLIPLLQHFSDENVFGVGCMDRSVEENGEIILRGRGIGKWTHGLLVHELGALDKTNTLWVSGGSSAYRKSLWNKLGGLYPIYNPFYWEDIDLSYRALKAGYTILFEKASQVVHEHEKGAIKSKYSRDEVRKKAFRNQFFFIWINATDSNIILSHLFWLPIQIVKAIMRKDTVLLTGISNAILQIPTVLIYRAKTQAMVKKSDGEVIKQISQ